MPGPIKISDAILHPILEQAHNNKWTAQSVSDNIWRSHQIKISVRTIRRRIEAWGLKHRVEYDEETVKKAVLDKHGKSYNQKRTLISMKNENKIVISRSTLARYEKRLQLNRQRDDLDLNKITYEELVQLINQMEEDFGHVLGIKSIKRKLMADHNLHIHRDVIAAILKVINPDMVKVRAAHKLKRRQYYAGGPNQVWASDGHDKLMPYGIGIYGFIDCWSRKLLGLHAHVTNSDPRHVDLWYLELVKKRGGIPHKLTTDRGTETIDLAGHQMYFGQQYGTQTPGFQYHRYVPSTDNTKIESAWEKMQNSVTGHLKDEIAQRIADGDYDPDDPMQRLLFLQLYVPAIQEALDTYIDHANNFQRRRDNRSRLPTGCSANYCYYNPVDEFGGTDYLIQVPRYKVDQIIEEDYPHQERLWTKTPEWFADVVDEVLSDMEFDYDDLRTTNVWEIFNFILERLRQYDWTGTPFAPQLGDSDAVFN